MKNRLLTFAGALALVAVLGKFYAVPAIAQVRSALVKNIDEKGRNPYSQHLSCQSNGSTVCQASFAAVPANKRLVIEHVNGGIQTPSNLAYATFQSNFATTEFIPFQLQSSATNNNEYVANQLFLGYFEAGQTPFYSVAILSGGFINAEMTITGYLIDLTQ